MSLKKKKKKKAGLLEELMPPWVFFIMRLGLHVTLRFSFLQVGAMVETKMPDGSFQEAVISKLTDASWYTVGE